MSLGGEPPLACWVPPIPGCHSPENGNLGYLSDGRAGTSPGSIPIRSTTPLLPSSSPPPLIHSFLLPFPLPPLLPSFPLSPPIPSLLIPLPLPPIPPFSPSGLVSPAVVPTLHGPCQKRQNGLRQRSAYQHGLPCQKWQTGDRQLTPYLHHFCHLTGPCGCGVIPHPFMGGAVADVGLASARVVGREGMGKESLTRNASA